MGLSIGLIGLGGFAKHTIVPGIHMSPDLELTAVYDASPAALNEIGQTLPQGSVCASATELIQRSDLDLVYVATPPLAHRALVEEVIAAGKHVMCEKPLAQGSEDAAALAALAADSGLVNAIDHEMRYAAVYQAMRDKVSSGYLGDVIYAAFDFSADYGTNPLYMPTYYWNFGSLKEAGGGILRQHMSHFVDLMFFFFGGIEAAGGHCNTTIKQKPVLVESVGSGGERVFSAGELRDVDAEDAIAVSGRLPNGAAASITATWATPVPTGTRWHLQGSDGVLIYQSDAEMTGLWGGELTGMQKGERLTRVELPADTFPEVGTGDPTYMAGLVAAQLLDVAHSIDTGHPGQFATFASEAEVWKAIEAWRP